MKLTLTRKYKLPRYTIGRLAIGDKYLCDTLEPAWRKLDPEKPGTKVPGLTAIPEGTYPVVITWSPRFRQWLPLLVNVPLFSGIRIHAGNTPADTEGCILPGYNQAKGMVLQSRQCLDRIKEEIVKAKAKNEAVVIDIS